MNWRQILIKVIKGAATAAGAAFGTMFATGIPMDKHALLAAGVAVGGAALHGGWNVAEQYLDGATQK